MNRIEKPAPNDWPALMAQMMRDAANADPIYLPGPYWKAHAASMIDVVTKYGIENFRAVPEKALLAFAVGSNWRPTTSLSPRFWTLHKYFLKTPIMSQMSRRYADEIKAGWKVARGQAGQKLHVVFALLKRVAPDLAELTDPLVGGPNRFDVEDQVYSEMFLMKLMELEILRQHVDFGSLRTVVEVGGSYGLLASIIMSRYPHIRYFSLDLAPISAFAEYHLGSVFPGQVVGYGETREYGEMQIEEDLGKSTILCAHQLDRIAGQADLFINTASFQEMTTQQVEMYCGFAKAHARFIYLNNARHPVENSFSPDALETALSPKRLIGKWHNEATPGYQPMLFGP